MPIAHVPTFHVLSAASQEAHYACPDTTQIHTANITKGIYTLTGCGTPTCPNGRAICVDIRVIQFYPTSEVAA